MPPKTRRPKARKIADGTYDDASPRRPVVIVEDLADFNESINFLIHGDSGTGKTPLAGQAPNAVFLSTEKGALSAKRFGSKAKRIKAYSWEEIEAALDYLDANPDGFDWLILDSLTKMQVLHIRWILRMANEDNESRDLDIPAIQDHQKWQNMFKRFVDRIIDMKINTIFICTSMIEETAEGDDIVLPQIEGKKGAISQYVCAQMDGVYCLKVKENKKTGEPIWHLLVRRKPPYFAKDRYNAFDKPVLVAPNMPDIITAIEKSAARAEELAAAQDDDMELEDDQDADEQPAKPRKRPAQRQTQAKTRKAPTRQRRRAAAPSTPQTDADGTGDEFDQDDDDIDFEDDD